MNHTLLTTRRGFLQGIAVAGSAAIWNPLPTFAMGYRRPSERPVIATIGLRNQGWLITEKALPFADVAALVDIDANVLAQHVEKAAAQARKPDAYDDYRKVLERKDIDAVLIATPDHWHTKIAVEAMMAGKDVYCEKPLTLTINEGKLIEEVVEKTRRIFQVGTQQRTEPAHLFLRAIALVRAGRIGQLRKITCGINSFESSPPIPVAEVPQGLDWDRWLGPAPWAEYRALPELREGYGGGVPLFSNGHYSFRMWHEYSGGKLTDWGAHHVDIACWALGASNTGIINITPQDFSLPVDYQDGYPVQKDRYNVATRHVISVKMPGDVEMIITSEGDNGILFEGTQGRFFVNRGRIVGRPIEDLESNPLPESAIEEVYGGPISPNHLANFTEALKEKKQPISDVWSHNRMLEICHLANISMRLNRPLDWDAAKRQIINDQQANSFLEREMRQGYEIDL